MKFVRWVLLAGLTLPGLVSAQNSFDFATSILSPGKSIRQVVIHGYLRSDDRAELIVVTIGETGKRLRVYSMGTDANYGETPLVDVDLPPDVILIDVGRQAGRDILVLFTADAALRFDPFSEPLMLEPLVTFSSIYNNPMEEEFPAMNLFRDVNDDGLDDFVIPGFKGYSVFLQGANGSFLAPSLMSAPPLMETSYNNHPWYQARKIFHADMTLNARKDMVFWIDDAFLVYEALPDGNFASEPQRLNSNVEFKHDGVEGVSFRMRDEDQSDFTAKALYQLADLNGDGITDLMTLTVRSEGVFKKQTTYDIHAGFRDEAGRIAFTPEPTSSIRSDGIQFELQEVDLNEDGMIDLAISSVQFGITKIIGALLTGSINFDLNFYQMQAGIYPSRANATRSVTASFDLTTGDVFFPFVLIVDLNGDGNAELLVQDGMSTLKIYTGVAGSDLFSRTSTDFKGDLPPDAEMIYLADLNNDGRKDIVMRLEKKNQDNRVKVLVNR